MQSALQGLGIPVPPSLHVPDIEAANNRSEDEERVEEIHEEQEEDEEEDEDEEEEGVVPVQRLEDLEGRDLLVHSLNSSFEDLVGPNADDRESGHSPVIVVRSSDVRQRAERKRGRDKKDKPTQDANSEPDIPIDSSAEEDAGKGHYIHPLDTPPIKFIKRGSVQWTQCPINCTFFFGRGCKLPRGI